MGMGGRTVCNPSIIRRPRIGPIFVRFAKGRPRKCSSYPVASADMQRKKVAASTAVRVTLNTKYHDGNSSAQYSTNPVLEGAVVRTQRASSCPGLIHIFWGVYLLGKCIVRHERSAKFRRIPAKQTTGLRPYLTHRRTEGARALLAVGETGNTGPLRERSWEENCALELTSRARPPCGIERAAVIAKEAHPKCLHDYHLGVS